MKKYYFLLVLLWSVNLRAQTPVTSIPFELFGDHIVVVATVDESRPLRMIFDTGSGITVVDTDVAEELPRVKHSVVLNHGTVSGSILKHNSIEINGFPVEKNIRVYAADLSHLEISLGIELDGIVGFDLMRHHTIRIDYNSYRMEVYDIGESPTKGVAIPFKFDTTIPVIEGTVVLNNGEPHEGNFYLMTGAGTTLDFNSPYAEQWDVIHKTGKHYSYPVKDISEIETMYYEGHIISLAFGNQLIEDLPIGISQAEKGIHANSKVSGIIGNQILRMYNITYDYADKMLYFVKNANYGKKFSVNCSGIDLQLATDKQRVLIHQVMPDSPASEAGIKLNSELVSINGQSMSEVTLPQVKEMLRQAGESVDLVINEDGAEKQYSLALRSLIE